MITIEEGLTAHLKANAGLTALISTRVYPGFISQTSTLPCLTYQRISTPRIITHDTSGASGTAHPRFQFDAWAETNTSAKAIIDAVRAALNGYKGTMGTVNLVTVQASLTDDERYEYSPEVKIHRYSADYIIWHEE